MKTLAYVLIILLLVCIYVSAHLLNRVNIDSRIDNRINQVIDLLPQKEGTFETRLAFTIDLKVKKEEPLLYMQHFEIDDFYFERVGQNILGNVHYTRWCIRERPNQAFTRYEEKKKLSFKEKKYVLWMLNETRKDPGFRQAKASNK